MDQDIVQVGSSEGSVGPEDEVHEMLEHSWGSVETKGQDSILSMASDSGKGGFGLSVWG